MLAFTRKNSDNWHKVILAKVLAHNLLRKVMSVTLNQVASTFLETTCSCLFVNFSHLVIYTFLTHCLVCSMIIGVLLLLTYIIITSHNYTHTNVRNFWGKFNETLDMAVRVT